MTLDTHHLNRTIQTLKQALEAVKKHKDAQDISYDLYRNAAIKSFELTLETAGKLLRKALKAFGSTPKSVDRLVFNDVLRHANKHGLLDNEAIERWLKYRQNRKTTAHDYGEGFTNETLTILPDFIQDVSQLVPKIQEVFDAQS